VGTLHQKWWLLNSISFAVHGCVLITRFWINFYSRTAYDV